MQGRKLLKLYDEAQCGRESRQSVTFDFASFFHGHGLLVSAHEPTLFGYSSGIMPGHFIAEQFSLEVDGGDH